LAKQKAPGQTPQFRGDGKCRRCGGSPAPNGWSYMGKSTPVCDPCYADLIGRRGRRVPKIPLELPGQIAMFDREAYFKPKDYKHS